MILALLMLFCSMAMALLATRTSINPLLASVVIAFLAMIVSYFFVGTNKDGKIDLNFGLPYFALALVAALAGSYLGSRSKDEAE